MKTIWKFPLALRDGEQSMLMPAGATILGTAMQGCYPTLWAEVDSSAEEVMRWFRVIGTGQAVQDKAAY